MERKTNRDREGKREENRDCGSMHKRLDVRPLDPLSNAKPFHCRQIGFDSQLDESIAFSFSEEN